MPRLHVTTILLLLAWLPQIGCNAAIPPFQRLTTTRPFLEQDAIHLLILGDWGMGNPAQQRVADAIADYVKKTGVKFDAALLPGDNFYVELTGVNDFQWQSLFERMYDPAVLNFPFFAALGNHDYEDGKKQIELDYARMNPNSRWKMPSQWYRLDFPFKKPTATVLMLDSCITDMPRTTWAAQKAWIETELRKPRQAPWMIWVAHHPPFSNGKNGDQGLIQAEWGDMLRRNKIDLFIAGHDHGLQHLEIPGWPTVIVSGAGSGRLNAMRRNDRGPFSKTTFGFVHLALTKEVAEIRIIDAGGELLHIARRSKSGQVQVLGTTPSDPKTIGWLRSMFGN